MWKPAGLAERRTSGSQHETWPNAVLPSWRVRSPGDNPTHPAIRQVDLHRIRRCEHPQRHRPLGRRRPERCRPGCSGRVERLGAGLLRRRQRGRLGRDRGSERSRPRCRRGSERRRAGRGGWPPGDRSGCHQRPRCQKPSVAVVVVRRTENGYEAQPVTDHPAEHRRVPAKRVHRFLVHKTWLNAC